MEMLKQTFEAVQAQAMYKLKHIFDKRNTETQEETAKQAFVVSRRQEILKIRDAINFWRCFTQTTMFHTDNKSMFHFSRLPRALQLHVGQWDWQRRKITDQCFVVVEEEEEVGERRGKTNQRRPALPGAAQQAQWENFMGTSWNLLLGSLCD